MNDSGNKVSAWGRSIIWLWVSGIAFILCCIGACGLIIFGQKLNNLGLSQNMYYITLVPLGLCCAAFLAGAMKAYASYVGKTVMPPGKINLSGPIVIFILVVGGGFVMPRFNESNQFNVKFRIQNKGVPSYQFNKGQVIAYLGDEKIQGNIHDGIAEIPNVPHDFNHKTIKVELSQTDEYELAGSDEVLIEKGKGYIDLPVVLRPAMTRVRGSLVDQKGKLIADAELDFGSGLANARTNAKGNFEAGIPLQEGQTTRLKISVGGVVRFNQEITISPVVPFDLRIDLTN